MGEKYAFFNVYGDPGTTWDRIIFGNNGSSGFESDNHTTRVNPWRTEPGEVGPEPGIPVMRVSGTTVSPAVTAVPETSTWVMGFSRWELLSSWSGASRLFGRLRTSESPRLVFCFDLKGSHRSGIA